MSSVPEFHPADDQLSLVGLEGHEPSSLWRDALDRLKANKLAVAGIIIVCILFFVATFGPYLTPYDFLSQDLSDRSQPP